MSDLEFLAAELDRVQEAFDRAKARVEELELVAAVSGVGTDPNGYYAGTPGFRVRQLQAAEMELDRAKPVIDAARAWREATAGFIGPIEGAVEGGWASRHEVALAAAVDAYDTAQKAPDLLRQLELRDGPRDPDCGCLLSGEYHTCGRTFRPGMEGVLKAPETAPPPTLANEPAEVDHPDADTTEPPAWLEEAAKAAFRAVWEYGDGKVLALDRDDWRIAIRAAAPIIAALTLASVSRPIEPRGRLAPEDYEDVAALRARLADAERERDRYQKGAEDCAAHLAEATAALTELAPSSLLAENVALRAQLAAARRATLNEAADALLKHRIDLHDGWAGYRNSVRDGRLGGLEEAATLLRERAKEDLQ